MRGFSVARWRRTVGVILLAALAAGGAAGCEGTDDTAGDVRTPTPDGFIFRPGDVAAPDTGPGADIGIKDAGGTDVGPTDAADGGALPDTPQAPDGGPPPDVPRPPDVPTGPDAQTCGADGVGCPCTSDIFCRGYDDGDLCNGQLVCRGGFCASDPATVVQCPAADGICREWRCQPSLGECFEVVLIEDGRPCEDGNACTGGDTCQAGTCTAGPQNLCGGGGCRKVADMACGGSYGVTTAAPTATDLIELYGCAAGVFSGPEMSYQLNAPANTQVVFNFTGGAADRMFLIPWGADCQVSQCVGSTQGNTKLHWKESAGGSYWVVVDSSSPFPITAGVQVQCHPKAADETGQTCLNQIDDDWDGQTDCTDPNCVQDPFCIPRVCGDDICHPTAEDAEECPADCWECGDGLCSEGYESNATCPGDCPCGDGVCSTALRETCASCPTDCGECPFPCMDEDIVCGQTISRSSLSGQDNSVSGFSCGCSSGSGNDRIYRFVPTTSGSVTVRLEIEDGFDCFYDYDLYVLENSCAATACADCSSSRFCSDTVTFSAQAGVPYLIVVESYSGTGDRYSLRVTCN